MTELKHLSQEIGDTVDREGRRIARIALAIAMLGTSFGLGGLSVSVYNSFDRSGGVQRPVDDDLRATLSAMQLEQDQILSGACYNESVLRIALGFPGIDEEGCRSEWATRQAMPTPTRRPPTPAP